MKNGGGQFTPKLGGHFELELGGHFKLKLGGQYHWNLHLYAVLYFLTVLSAYSFPINISISSL